MTHRDENYRIKQGVMQYLESEREKEQGGGYSSKIYTLLSEGETVYFEKYRETGDEYIASDSAQNYIARFAPRFYDELVAFTKIPDITNLDNIDKVQKALTSQLNILFRIEQQRFRGLFGSSNRELSREQAYIKFLDEVSGELPSYVFTDFILDRDIQGFVTRVHEYYRTTKHTVERTRVYHKLLYVLNEDPKLYPPQRNNTLKWVELNNLVFGYIISGSNIKDKVSVPNNSEQFYENIKNWNKRGLHNVRHGSEFEKAYVGAIALKNNLYPSDDVTKALYKTVEYVIKAKGDALGVDVDLKGSVESVKSQLNFSGVALITVNDVVFVIGKKLYILERGVKGLEVKASSPYSMVKKKDIEKVIKHATKNKK